jgi:DNA polymerase-3 subunit delta
MPTSLAELERSLSEGQPRPIYVVVGEAAPLVERAVRLVEHAVRPRLGPPAFNHARFRAGDEGGTGAFDTARTLPMLGELRLVEVRGLEEGLPAVFEALVAYAAKPSADAVLVASGAGFPKVEKGGSNWAVRVKNAVKKTGVLVEIGGADLDPVAFAVGVARAAGKELTRDGAAALVENVGSDLGHLEQEIGKLASYVGSEPQITGEDVAAATALLAEAVIWDLTGALAARDADRAIEALHRLQSGGDDARRLLGMIAWQMRELLRAAELLQHGVRDNEIVSRVRLRWDLFRAVKPTLGEGFPDAADLLRRIATANRHMNSHRAGADRILEGLVFEMLEGKLRRPPPVPRPR